MHMAEPLACWQPLVEGKPHYGYYKSNPKWHMYGKKDYPSHEEIITARDRVVEKYPNLPIIGAHLGSMEYDVNVIAERFEKYPNFSVDTSARLDDMVIQDSQVVRKFFMKYQDRILFGTDFGMLQPRKTKGLSEQEKEEKFNIYKGRLQDHHKYFGSSQEVTINERTVQGLGLPNEVLEKIYVTNAEKWYPGIAAN